MFQYIRKNGIYKEKLKIFERKVLLDSISLTLEEDKY